MSPKELKYRASRGVLLNKEFNSKLLHYFPLVSRQIGDFKSILSNKVSFASFNTFFTSWRTAPELKASRFSNFYSEDGYSPIKRHYLHVMSRDTLTVKNVKSITSIEKYIT